MTPAFDAAAWRPPPFVRSRTLRWVLGLLTGVYLAAALGSIDVDWTRVVAGLERGGAFLAAFGQPDFVTHWSDIRAGLIESLTMTVTSTLVGIVISIPVALGAARNLAHPIVYYMCRAIIAASRAFQEIILAILFVAMFGFGPFAGFVTLAFATIGFFAKFMLFIIAIFIGNLCSTIVFISDIVILKLLSPSINITNLFLLAICAPIAYGKPAPITPREPLDKIFFGY